MASGEVTGGRMGWGERRRRRMESRRQCVYYDPTPLRISTLCVCVSGADHSALSHFDIEGRETIQVKKNGGFFSKPMLIADWEERRPFFSLFFFLKKKKGSKVPRVLLFTISRCCPLKADRYMLVFFYLSVKSVDGGQRAGRKGGGERRRRRRRNWKKRNQRSER